MAKFRNRNRKGGKGGRKASVSQVKAIVKREVGKTRETNKLVSYVAWSRLNDILLTNLPAGPTLPDPSQAIACYSLTGGLLSTIDFTQDPGAYIAKSLFVLLPSDTSAGALAGVGQAQQGGMVNQMDGSAGVGAQQDASSIANVHQLEGRQCFLKKFYASFILNNSSSSVTDPTNVVVRCLVIETRRPLSSDQLGKQILLQNHCSLNMAVGSTTTTQFPCSAVAYLNRDVIKKVYVDRVITLNGGGGATGSLKRFKIAVNINKKARWSYYYPSGVPTNANAELTYQGPYIYMVMWAASSSTFGSSYTTSGADAGIGRNRRPAWTMSNILTFMDD